MFRQNEISHALRTILVMNHKRKLLFYLSSFRFFIFSTQKSSSYSDALKLYIGFNTSIISTVSPKTCRISSKDLYAMGASSKVS